MYECAAFGCFDFMNAIKCLSNVVNELDGSAEIATHLNSKCICSFRHYHFGSCAKNPRSIYERDRVISGGNSRDAARKSFFVEIEHDRQCTARFEASRSLEQLFFQPDCCRLANRFPKGVIDNAPNRCGDDQVTKSRAIRANRIDGGKACSHAGFLPIALVSRDDTFPLR